MEMTPEQQAAALFEDMTEAQKTAHLLYKEWSSQNLFQKGPLYNDGGMVLFAAFCLEKREREEFKAVAEISERLKFSNDYMANAEKMLPTDFVMWYSGMPMDKILKAYERFIKEKP